MQISEQRIHDWLINRKISEAVLDSSKISWNGDSIVIPIFDETGEKILFNKYRRDPEVLDGPKYKYDKGSTSQLYGLHLLKNTSELFPIVICEGELDALVLQSIGITAVSSTGGAGTFEEEWIPHFKDRENVFICYDNDEAGIKGALHVHAMLPRSKCVWLPLKVGEHGDVTDFFVKLNKNAQDFLELLKGAERYFIPLPMKEIPKTKKELNRIIKTEGEYASTLTSKMAVERSQNRNYKHFEVLIDYLLQRILQHKRTLKYMNKVRNEKNSIQNIKTAKMTPIPLFIQFDRTNTAKCIFHNENTASMHYYPQQNRVKCFGCGKMGDVIDVVMELRKVTLTQAIEIILGNYEKEK